MAEKRIWLLRKAAQLDLFTTSVPVRGHARADGAYVKPHMARRRKAPDQPKAQIHPVSEPLAGDALIAAALDELRSRLRKGGDVLSSPEATKQFLELKLSGSEHEVFAAVFLDTRHRVIDYKELFRGTIDGASVYPREVVKEALAHNASAVIFAHNHPSGVAEPSRADRDITTRLRDALGMVDIRVLDHLVVGTHGEITSFAERGLL